MVSAMASRSAPKPTARRRRRRAPAGAGGSVERAVPRGGDDDLDAHPGVVGESRRSGDLRGGLRAAAAHIGVAVPSAAETTYSSECSPPRSHAWRRWDWPPGPRIRCRGRRPAGRRTPARRPARAPSTARDERGGLDLAHPWPRSRPAVRAGRQRDRGARSAIRRAARPARIVTCSGSALTAPRVSRSAISRRRQPQQIAVHLGVVLAGPAGPALRTPPGSPRGPGSRQGPTRYDRSARRSARPASRARSCGSRTTSATVLIGPLITCGAEGFDDVVGLSLRGQSPMILSSSSLVAAARDVVDEPVFGGELGLPHRGTTAGRRCPGWPRSPPNCRRRCGRCSTAQCLPAGFRRSAHHAADVVVRNGGLCTARARPVRARPTTCPRR